MHLNRRIRLQLAIFTVVALVAGIVMIFGYIKLPALLFGVDRYTVTLELPEAAGLYKSGNVTYRGTEVGRVEDVRLTDTGVEAVLSLKSGVAIPSDLRAEVHSQSAVGEQYVALLPRNGSSRPLKNGDVIARADAAVPPNINALVDAANRGLQAIPRDNLKTAVDESNTAIGGLGPDLSRLVKGSTSLAIDSRQNLDALTTLIDQSKPVLDSQADTSDAIRAWAAHISTVTEELKTHDSSLAGFIDNGASAADEGRQLFERLKPTLPIILANLVSVGQVAVAYQPGIEEALVLLPPSVGALQAAAVANLNTKQSYKGAYLDFNLNVNVPPPCTTGYIPAQQQRVASLTDAPDVPAGDVYCRLPQDSNLLAVRGARNLPCLTVPGKRAPTAAMCESDQNYVPLNDGMNWKGDPNATLSGQDIPQLPPGAPPSGTAGPQVAGGGGTPPPAFPSDPQGVAPAPPPLAAVQYDPATGSYLAPNGRMYTQADLARPAGKDQTWQAMLLPPPG
jgi:phospholipid/cholesterol/gamma-HCH transport system substrate-binding protein